MIITLHILPKKRGGFWRPCHAVNYGFDKVECRKFYSTREFTAAQYVEYCGTHCDHLALQEPYRTRFFEGIKNAVLEEGDKIIFNDTITLYLTAKSFTKL